MKMSPEVRQKIADLFAEKRGGYFKLEEENKEWELEFADGIITLLSSLGYEIVKTGKLYLTREQAWLLFVNGVGLNCEFVDELKPQFDKLLAEITGEK